MAKVLHVEIEELTGPESQETSSSRPYPIARQIERAMVSYTALDDAISNHIAQHPCDTRNLEHRISTAHQRYQAARYEEAGQLIPRESYRTP